MDLNSLEVGMHFVKSRAWCPELWPRPAEQGVVGNPCTLADASGQKMLGSWCRLGVPALTH